MLKLLDIVCILASFGWVGFKPMIHGDDIMAKKLGPLRWRWTCDSLDANRFSSWQQVEEISCRETMSHLSTESSSQTMRTLLSVYFFTFSVVAMNFKLLLPVLLALAVPLAVRRANIPQHLLGHVALHQGRPGSGRILEDAREHSCETSLQCICFKQDRAHRPYSKGIIKSNIWAMWFKVQRVLEIVGRRKSNARNGDFRRNANSDYSRQNHFILLVLFVGENCSKSRAFFPNPLGLCSSPPEMLSSMLRVAEHWTRSFDRWVLTRCWAWCMWCMISIYLSIIFHISSW